MENSNGNQQSETFYTYRGVTKCLSAGISFLTDNFLYITKVSLPFALAYSVFTSALVYISSDSSFIQKLTVGTVSEKLTMCGAYIGLLIMLMLSSMLFNGLIYRMVHIHSHGISLKRYGMKQMLRSSMGYGCKYFCFEAVFLIVYSFLAALSVVPLLLGGEGTVFMILKFGGFAVIAALLFVSVLPLSISEPAIFLEKGKLFRNAFNGYKKGMKVWGKIFCLALLLSIFVMLMMLVISLPSVIMINGFKAATLSQVNGDAVHMPGGFQIWYAIVLLITYYIFTFLFWVQKVPFCYLYSAIKSDERAEAKNQYAIKL